MDKRRDAVQYTCKPCINCNKRETLTISVEGYRLWKHEGKYVQDAFPELSDDDRELLISGTCKECFAALFPPDEDEDDDNERFTCDDLGCVDVGVGVIHHHYCGRLYKDIELEPPSVKEEEMFPPDLEKELK